MIRKDACKERLKDWAGHCDPSFIASRMVCKRNLWDMYIIRWIDGLSCLTPSQGPATHILYIILLHAARRAMTAVRLFVCNYPAACGGGFYRHSRILSSISSRVPSRPSGAPRGHGHSPEEAGRATGAMRTPLRMLPIYGQLDENPLLEGV